MAAKAKLLRLAPDQITILATAPMALNLPKKERARSRLSIEAIELLMMIPITFEVSVLSSSILQS